MTILGLAESFKTVNRPDPARPDPTRPDPTRPDPTPPDPTRPDPTATLSDSLFHGKYKS